MHIEYRGEVTDTYVRALKQSTAPIRIVLTTRKIKNCLPSLKTSIHKGMQSKIVYEFTCSRCNATYLGKTKRHLKTRIQEHKNRKHQVLYKHVNECGAEIGLEDFKIIDKTFKDNNFLLTLEAVHIVKKNPKLNTLMTSEDQRNKVLKLVF